MINFLVFHVVNTSLAVGGYPLQDVPDKRTVKTPAVAA
jgi:hypothetical protein